jgi:hypothetical protein
MASDQPTPRSSVAGRRKVFQPATVLGQMEANYDPRKKPVSSLYSVACAAAAKAGMGIANPVRPAQNAGSHNMNMEEERA